MTSGKTIGLGVALALMATVAIISQGLQMSYSQPGDPTTGILNDTGMVPLEDKSKLQPLLAECGPVLSCAYFVYSSNNTLVISGDESIPSANPDEPAIPKLADNVGLWKIVDYFKDKGYVVNAVFLKDMSSGDSLRILQDQYRIIMSKQQIAK